MTTVKAGTNNNDIVPIKRNESLKALSREHHHGLLFCWKIRTGLQGKISLDRIKKYAEYFFNENLKKHFETEEKFIFPLLLKTDPLVVTQALKDHFVLRELFEKTDDLNDTLQAISIKLQAHIRFEERVMFKKLQETVSEKKLLKTLELHKEECPVENYPDPFWLLPLKKI